MDPATITLIVSGIVTIIQVCRDKNPDLPDEELLSAARGARGFMAIRRSARANGFRGRRFRNVVRESWAETQAMTDDELMEVIRAPEAEVDEDGNHGIDYDLFA